MSRHSFVSVVVALLAITACQAELQINTYTTHDQIYPAVAINAGGDFVVVWRSRFTDGRGGGLYGQRFSADGARLGDEFNINMTQIDVGVWTPSVAMHSSGSFVVVWATADSGHPDIVARMYDEEGEPVTDEFVVNTLTEGPQWNPRISMNSSGDFVVVWGCWCGPDYIGKNFVAGRLFDAAGLPKADEFTISRLPHGCVPDVAMDDSGDFVVTWLREGDMDDRPLGQYIRLRRYEADGTPKADVVEITSDLRGRWYGPSVATDPNGNSVIAWAVGPWPHDIVAERFDPNGVPIGKPSIVNTYTEGNQGAPRVAMNRTGQFVIVWESKDQYSISYDVYGQRYNPDGTRLGGEFRLNSYTLDKQWYSDVAMSDSGSFVTVWVSEQQDGSGYGVFGEVVVRPASPDCNGDGFVDFVDFCVVAEQWHAESAPYVADVATDGRIDSFDLICLAEHWLSSCSQ